MVSGTVSETVDGGSRPVAGLRVDIFINGTCGVNCTTETEEVFVTDHAGRYTAHLPKSRVFVMTDHYNGTQPCLATAVVDKDTTIDVQVVPAGRSSTPPSAASPMITGFVYETTPQGRNPVRDAWVWLEVGINSYPVAATRTDDAGRFFLCRQCAGANGRQC